MSGIGTKNFAKVYCGTKEVNSIYAGNNKVYSSGPAPIPTYTLLGVNNTTESDVSATLNIAKNTYASTKIYLDNVLQTTTTTTGTQDIALTIPTGTHTIKIDGEFYFDSYCLGSSANNAYLTSIILPDTYTQFGGSNIFDGCTNLTETRFYGTIAQWASILFPTSLSNPVSLSGNLYIGRLFQCRQTSRSYRFRNRRAGRRSCTHCRGRPSPQRSRL